MTSLAAGRSVLLLYNAPSLPLDHPDYAQEAGVLESVDAVEAALSWAGHDVERLGILSLDELTHRLQSGKPSDVVFNLCEGFGGRGEGETQVAELLERHPLPFTGSPPAALKLARDKVETKRALEAAGIATPPYVFVPAGSVPRHDTIAQLLANGPVFIKPASEDASLGITGRNVCETASEAMARVDVIGQQYGGVLVERFIAGREFNVSVIALPDVRALPLAEIVFGDLLSVQKRVVSYEAKWATGSVADRLTPVRCPASTTAALADQITSAAISAFRIVGCKQYARIDLRVDEQNNVFVLEVNANPDLSPSAGLARAIAAAGMPLAEFFRTLAEQAIATLPRCNANHGATANEWR